MRVVIAPQAFKGSISALEAAHAIEDGVLKVYPRAQTVIIPISDGGPFFLEILTRCKSGRLQKSHVCGPVQEKIEASWSTLTDGAIIEMAKVCGLGLISKDRRNPSLTTTYGLGELIKIALDRGLRNFWIGLGGSATNDAGTGMMRALGVKFLDATGKELPLGGISLSALNSIDTSGLDSRLQEAKFTIVCDVTNPLLGAEGATYTYASQKGASENDIPLLENALTRFAVIVQRDLGMNISAIPRCGAAGGTASSFYSFLRGNLIDGIDFVLDQIHFDHSLDKADLVITGEGCFDHQTTYNKGPCGIALRAYKYHIPTVAVVGKLGPGYEAATKACHISKVQPLETGNFAKTYHEIVDATEKLLNDQP